LPRPKNASPLGTPSGLRNNVSRFRYIVPSTINGERHHNEVAGAWRDAWCDLLATVPTTQQGAIALIDGFLLCQEADIDRTQLARLTL
jgi:hypothetical protein